ncbi:unnamed protein product [Arctogadus glacialis]
MSLRTPSSHTEHARFLMGVFISQRRLDSCPLQMTPATCPETAPTSRGAAAGRRDSQRAEQRVCSAGRLGKVIPGRASRQLGLPIRGGLLPWKWRRKTV